MIRCLTCSRPLASFLLAADHLLRGHYLESFPVDKQRNVSQDILATKEAKHE